MSARLVSIHSRDGGLAAFWCPGCEGQHTVRIAGPHAWTFNGDHEKPSLQPSVLVTGVQWGRDEHFYRPQHNVERGGKTVCHSFVRDGRIQFLTDSTHKLAGQTVDLPAFPTDA